MPSLGVVWAEGRPGDGVLATAAQVQAASERVESLVDERFGVREARGVSRSDQTVTMRFVHEQECRAFLAGMAAVSMPRCETTRRGAPVHSVWWTDPRGARIQKRVYDKGHEQGGERARDARLEDQRRYPSGRRPYIEAVADPDFLRGRFEASFGPVRKAVSGMTAVTFPVLEQTLADEFRYGFRDQREFERLAGAVVALKGGASEAYSRRTFYRRRAELREAGYVVVDDLAEAVSVNLGEVVESAIESPHWG
jgi:hypothetical protein